MASPNTTSSAKTHVSLRLPTYILESIDAHAEKESISRTEAFVFYLQTGLDIADTKANEPSKDESMLQSIQEELAEIKAMLRSQQMGQPVSFEAIEDETEVEDAADVEDEADDFTTSDVVSFPPLDNTETEAAEETFEEASSDATGEAEDEELVTDSDTDTDEQVVATEEDDEDEDRTAESEAFAETYFSASDAVSEETLEDADDEDEVFEADEAEEPEETDEDDEDDFSDSDAVMEEPESNISSLYAIGETEGFTEIKPLDDLSDFTTSDALSEDADSDEAEDEGFATAEDFTTSDAVSFDDDYAYAEADDRSEENTLSQKKLEKAVAKAAKDISAIEKVWLYGPAAESKEITESSIDLCVKTEDDEIKSKHLEAFVAAVEEKTGKLVNVILRHEVSKDQKQTMKNKVELYKK